MSRIGPETLTGLDGTWKYAGRGGACVESVSRTDVHPTTRVRSLGRVLALAPAVIALGSNVTNNSDNSTSDSTGISRRTLVKGAAWAAPVIAVGAVVPTAAASLPPCFEEVSGVTQNSWSVPNATFAGCPNPSTHFDVNIQVTVKACDARKVTVRVYDLADEPATNGRRSRLWWSDRDSSTPYLFIQKTITVPAVGSTTVPFVTTGDQVRWSNSQFGNTGGRGPITAPPNSENDGIHVNPCYFGGAGSSNIVAKFYYRLDDDPTWLGPHYITATRPA